MDEEFVRDVMGLLQEMYDDGQGGSWRGDINYFLVRYKAAQQSVQADGGEVLPPHNHIYVDGYCACGHAVERHRR